MTSQMISKMQGSATLSGTLGVATVVHPGLSTSHFDINRRTSFLSSTLALSAFGFTRQQANASSRESPVLL